MKERMLEYLQEMLTSYKEEAEKFGVEERGVRRKFDAMIACKEMVEALICEPVNLGKNGVVSVGF